MAKSPRPLSDRGTLIGSIFGGLSFVVAGVAWLFPRSSGDGSNAPASAADAAGSDLPEFVVRLLLFVGFLVVLGLAYWAFRRFKHPVAGLFTLVAAGVAFHLGAWDFINPWGRVASIGILAAIVLVMVTYLWTKNSQGDGQGDAKAHATNGDRAPKTRVSGEGSQQPSFKSVGVIASHEMGGTAPTPGTRGNPTDARIDQRGKRETELTKMARPWRAQQAKKDEDIGPSLAVVERILRDQQEKNDEDARLLRKVALERRLVKTREEAVRTALGVERLPGAVKSPAPDDRPLPPGKRTPE